MIRIKSKSELKKMRAAGRLAARILNDVGSKVKRGVSTLELNDYANELTLKAGARSAPYLYQVNPTDPPFPKHVCTSINNVVCHGIPKDNEYLKKGDIINIDITVILDGYHGDTSRTFVVGKAKPPAKKLAETTQQAMMVGIDAAKPGGCVSDIGKAIEAYVKPHRYGIVDRLTGHGLGRFFHEEPTIFHCYNPSYRRKIKPGMCFTCEPMLNLGSKDIMLLADGWTIVTVDGGLSAQFEHSLAVTEDSVEILTKLD